ncbi:MAG: DUF2812 domain-containing protein [Lachnospiraceae bacterium]|nr:DUF2812 domain-containing protein [Lachnospiraceae bacterium]
MKMEKRRFERFMIYDATGIEEHLERMAAQGWMLKKIGKGGWVYSRVEPVKLKFSVVYYPAASEFDPYPSDAQKTLWDFCEKDGWRLAASWVQMQIFYHEGENPRPIETDALLQLENIQRSMKRSFLPSSGILLVLSILQCSMLGRNIWRDPAETLSYGLTLHMVSAWCLLFVLCVKNIGEYLCWYKKAKKTAEEGGGFLRIRVNRRLEGAALVYILGGTVLWVIFMIQSRQLVFALCGIFHVGVLFLWVSWVKKRVKQWKVSVLTKWSVTLLSALLCSGAVMAVLVWLCISHGFGAHPAGTYEYMGMEFEIYEDPLPLTVEDLTGKTYAGYLYKCKTQSTFLCSQTTCGQRPRLDAPSHPTLAYTITEVRAPFLYEFLLEGIKREYARWEEFYPSGEGEVLTQSDAKPWGAREAYAFSFPERFPVEYVVCYEDRIVEIQFGWEPSQEEIRMAGDVLRAWTKRGGSYFSHPRQSLR